VSLPLVVVVPGIEQVDLWLAGPWLAEYGVLF
jgi:hypothetical protein